MSSPLEVARAHYATRSRLVSAVAGEAARLWSQVDPARVRESWTALIPRLLLVLVGAQQSAAGRADSYLNEVLDAQGVHPRSSGRVDARSLAGVASDGRDLAELLYQPTITALAGVRDGATVDRALAGGRATLDMIARTQVADAGRVADQVALTARPRATGYVRMLAGKSCGRCAILAGRRYEWNAGFNRHPRCDCIGIPAREDSADDLRTDPRLYFRSLVAADQDRLFTKSGAAAIREGADMNQVVNARLGMYTAGGERLTRSGATPRGFAGQRLGARKGKPAKRLMPEQIFVDAKGDRDEALRLLRLHGYLV